VNRKRGRLDGEVALMVAMNMLLSIIESRIASDRDWKISLLAPLLVP
jgi:hypothetical protein